ncbi:MAG: hypothetical protein IT352_18210 [Gemmatimonadales bacterium]|nr:hypothetical protein [Gemmatimonadales bacterium]
MQLHLELQQALIADEVSALTSVVRPILTGTLFALKQDVVAEAGGYTGVKLFMLPRLYRPGDGDCGVCFEYAVHDAVRRNDPTVLERVEDALKTHCRLKGKVPASILFGAEKTGAIQLIDTSRDLLTSSSVLLYGARGRPAGLQRHIDSVAAAFRKPETRRMLPRSIQGLWKADLFLGHSDTDKWVGSTVKINPDHLEGAKGLRIGIVPTRQGRSDKIRMDDPKNLVVCPLPYDGAFMETFYMGWQIVQQFIHADAKVPKEVALPQAAARQVARYLADRREFPVLDVVEALVPLSQPALLTEERRTAEIVLTRAGNTEATTVVAPFAAAP